MWSRTPRNSVQKSVLAEPATVSESFAAGMGGLAEEDIVLIGFPDTVWQPEDGFQVLVRAVQSGCDARARPFPIPGARSPAFGRRGDRRIRKGPRCPREAGRAAVGLGVWGCAAARAGTMAGLAGAEVAGGYFGRLSVEGRDVRGFPLSG